MGNKEPSIVIGAEVVAGVSVALTGRLARQGREALRGLQLWISDVERAGGLVVDPAAPRRRLRLIVLDDESRSGRARDNAVRLLDEHGVGIMFGPYGSGLVLAVAPLSEARGRILWNHGGTADTLWERGFRHVVSVASPASRYFAALPGVLRSHDPGFARVVVIHSERGHFAPAVARGVPDAAAAAGWEPAVLVPFSSPLVDVEALLDRVREADPHLLVGVGSFDDDVRIARACWRLLRPARVAVVAAGVDAFGQEAGDAAEGVIGPSQWEPDDLEPTELGPDSRRFTAGYRAAFAESPGYVAAQAYASGLIIGECLRRATSLDDAAVLSEVRRLQTRTFFGAFQAEPSTLRQVGHRMHLVAWRRGRKVLLEET